MSRWLGSVYETKALQFLKQQGMKIIARNYVAAHAEIDIIAIHAQTLVFVEVRFRKADAYGSSLESVTVSKQRHLIRAAQCYLRAHLWAGRYAQRFDIIAMTAGDSPRDSAITINWIQDAFTVGYED